MVRVIRGGSEHSSHVDAGSGEQPPVPLQVAALNLSPEPGDVEGNLRLAERALTGARRAHPGLEWVVLPELFTTAYSDLASVHRHAENAERGPSARFFAALARDLGLHVAYGFPERLPAGGVSDSANLVGPGGILLTYRKRHLVRTTGEDLVFVPGAELPVVEAGGLRVALVVCWDLGFPQTVREAALAGAQLVLSPAGWRYPWGPQYDLSCAARALDNAVYLASANQLGAYPDAAFDAPGGVYGPDGTRVSLCCASADSVLSIASVDPYLPERWQRSYGSTLCEEDAEIVPQRSRPEPEDLGEAHSRVLVS
ncbi:MAG TPA: carbon-nitrogen hydrolase family protein [Rubrobacteraceae bacterium]|nr:carbon-nitrogen hydrolase family protein [Rubrobacteraceae bacterium]